MSKEDLYDYLDDDYDIPLLTVLNKDQDKVCVEDHRSNYFKKAV